MKIEVNKNFIKAKDIIRTGTGVILITPPLNEDYWILKVKVSKNQAIVAFPKFGLAGIGFQYEDKDWNTNLPVQCTADKIYNHIRRNRRTAKKQTCIKAIELIQSTLEKSKG